jgi:hypothetical protein
VGRIAKQIPLQAIAGPSRLPSDSKASSSPMVNSGNHNGVYSAYDRVLPAQHPIIDLLLSQVSILDITFNIQDTQVSSSLSAKIPS